VRPSFRPSTSLSAWNSSAANEQIFIKFDVWNFFFGKSVEDIQVSLKSHLKNGHFIWSTIHIFDRSRSTLLRMRNVLDNICGENQNTYFIKFSNSSSENRTVYGIAWTNTVYSDRSHSTINTTHANCLQDKQGYWHTLGICIIYCFSTTTLVTPTRLNVMSYVHCLSCLCNFWMTHSISSDEYLVSKMRVTFEMWTKACNSNFHAPYTSANTKQKHAVWAERRISEC
jgi:hypothetical protein